MVKMGTVWDRTVEFLGDHLGTVMPLALLAIFVPTSISGALQPLQASGAWTTRLLLGALSLGLMIVQLWGGLAIAAIAIDTALAPRARQVATARLLPALGVWVLLLLGVLVLTLPIFAILTAGGVDWTRISTAAPGSMPLAAGTAGTVTLYALALLVALLFIGARMAPLTAVIVAERRGIGAIARSFSLTRGLTWRLIGVLLLYIVVAVVASMAVTSVFGTILALIAGGDGPVTVASVITAIVGAAVSTAFTVLGTAFAAKLYTAVVHGREGASPPPAA